MLFAKQEASVAGMNTSPRKSRFRNITFSVAKAEALATKAITDSKRNGVFLALRNGKAVGFLWCSIGEYHVGEGALLTTIHVAFVLHEVRSTLSGGRAALGLLAGARSWSKARGSKEVLLHVTSGVGVERAERFLGRLGFVPLGGSFGLAI